MGGRTGRTTKRVSRPKSTDRKKAEQPSSATVDDFPELMDRVRKAITDYGREQSAPSAREAVDVAGAELEKLLPKLEPLLPRRFRKGVGRLWSLADLKALVEGRGELWPRRSGGLDPTLYHLVGRNIRYAKERGRAAAIAEDLRTLAESVSPKRRGRPPSITLKEVVEARKLKLSGLSYAAVARKLKRDPKAIRSALRHHYPEKKSN